MSSAILLPGVPVKGKAWAAYLDTCEAERLRRLERIAASADAGTIGTGADTGPIRSTTNTEGK